MIIITPILIFILINLIVVFCTIITSKSKYDAGQTAQEKENLF